MSATITTASQRIRAPIATRELERRWSAVRKGMKDADIDILVMQNDNQYLGGYVRYFTDFPARTGYPVTVLFPEDDGMTMVSHGGPPKPPGPPAWAVRGARPRMRRATWSL